MANTTWNPSDKTAGVTLSGGNLTAAYGGSGTQGVRTTDRQVSGKYYWEATTGPTSVNIGLGLANGAVSISTLALSGPSVGCAWVQANGTLQCDGVQTGSAVGVYSTNTTVCFALDLNARLLWVRIGAAGNWNNAAGPNPATGVGGYGVPFGATLAAYPFVFWASGSTSSVIANFGDSAFVGAVPSGFTAGFPTGAPTNIISLAGLGREALVTADGSVRLGGVARETLISGVTPVLLGALAREVLLVSPPPPAGPRLQTSVTVTIGAA